MHYTRLLSAIACLILPSSAFPASTKLCGPEFTPPFEVKQSKRQPPQLVTQTFLDSARDNQPMETASLNVGNKRISIREIKHKEFTSKNDNGYTLFINNIPVFSITWAGGYQGADQKFVNFFQSYKPEDVKLISDPATNTIRWLRSYPLPDAAQATYTLQLKAIGDSLVEISWDPGITDAQIEGYKIKNCLMYLSMPEAYRKAGVEINGSLLKPQSDDALKQADKQGVSVWQGKLDKLTYNPNKPQDGFSLTLPDSPDKTICTETFAYGRHTLGLRMNAKLRNKIILDLGEAAVVKNDLPPAIEGHDLWAQDALHQPKSPNRNLFPNPSFEQGIRYWRWMDGGANYTRDAVSRYAVDPANGLFGKSALLINPTQTSSASLMSFSLPSKKGQSYTFSFYAKAEKEGAYARFSPFSTKIGGKFDRNSIGKSKMEKLTTEWQRFSQTLVSDGAPFAMVLGVNNIGGKVWIDGIQFESGDKATDFVNTPMEGRLFTSDPDGNVEFGKKLDAAFELSGPEGTKGEVELTLRDFFKNALWQKTFSTKAGERLALPFDSLELAKGTYSLQAKYTVAGTEPYFDYYRFVIIESLNGTHATKDLYGGLFMTRINRAEDMAELMRRCGFGGSTSYGPGTAADPFHYEIRKKYNITDYTHTLGDGVWIGKDRKKFDDPDYRFMMELNPRIWRTAEQAKQITVRDVYTDEDVRRIENIAYRSALAMPEARVWALGTEEEIVFPSIANRRDYKEFSKLSLATYRGVKKANPKAIVLPSGGTSGYGKIRGKDAIEGYLASTQGQVKWDAVAIHPYGSCDGTLGQDDLDDNLAMLRDSMAKYGYGKETPIFLNEGGGQGSPACWGDGPDYSYRGGHPSYDQGLREFLHACKMARQYIICLKYWPQVEHFNCWQDDRSTVVDYNLTPSSAMLGINTLGHLLGKPAYVADIRPAPGMRGYAFNDEKGNGIAAVWCTIDNVELGFERGPEMRVNFKGLKPDMFDLMGKRYPLVADEEGYVNIRLTPAPLFFRSASPQKLVAALKEAEVSGAGTSIRASFLPTREGKITAKLENLTGRKQSGELIVKDQKNSFSIAPMKSIAISLAESVNPEFGKIYQWHNNYALSINGKTEPEKPWAMDYFYVPRVKGAPEWEKIPSIAITNLYRPTVDLKQTPGGQKGDIEASFKIAWDEKNLYLRVEAQDDIFNPRNDEFWTSPDAKQKALYRLDGCLEVYFDCGANGRLRKGGFDLDDYRYDFCTGNPEGQSSPGLVSRLQEVFIEYAGGPAMPSKEDAAKGIKCEFTRLSPTRYAYTITFEQKYIEPLHLQKGSIAGFGLYLHDRMDDGTMGNKGLSLATEPGVPCDAKPQLWPLMILGE